MPAYNPGDPFAGGFGSGTQGLLRQGGQMGFFSPGGSQSYRATARRRLLGQGRSRRNRGSLLARLAGLDSMGQQNAMVNTEQDIAGDTARDLNEFDFNDYGQNRDYFRGMLGQERGFEEERRREQEARKMQFLQFLGGLGGMAGQAGLAALTGGGSLAVPRKSKRAWEGAEY